MATQTHISDLHQDPRNARKHNERNLDMITASLTEVGTARSIVIDEDNIILAGNGTVLAAEKAGIMNVRIIEAKGDEIIAVKRTNLTSEEKRKLSLYDNRSSELAEWDADVLAELSREVDLSGLWSNEERFALFAPISDNDLERFFSAVVNKEAESKQVIKLEYTQEIYEKVKKSLAKVAATPEKAVCILCGVE